MIVGKGFDEGGQLGQGMLAGFVTLGCVGARGGIRFGGGGSTSMTVNSVAASFDGFEGPICFEGMTPGSLTPGSLTLGFVVVSCVEDETVLRSEEK